MVDSVLIGVVDGVTYSVLAVCVVLLYRLTGVLNIAQGALGAFGAFTVYLASQAGVPWPVAVATGFFVGGVLAGFVGWILARWFADPSPTVKLTVSIVVFSVLLALGYRLFGDSPRVMNDLIPATDWRIAGVHLSSTTLVAVGLIVVLSASSTLVLRRTTFGLRLRAMAEQPLTLELLGFDTKRLAIFAWAVTGIVSTLMLCLVVPTRNPTFDTMAFLVAPALAAALLGRFTNVWVAAIGGILIGMLDAIGTQVSWLVDYRDAVPFVVIILAVIWLRRAEAFDVAR